jgi:hypothetical protein
MCKILCNGTRNSEIWDMVRTSEGTRLLLSRFPGNEHYVDDRGPCLAGDLGPPGVDRVAIPSTASESYLPAFELCITMIDSMLFGASVTASSLSAWASVKSSQSWLAVASAVPSHCKPRLSIWILFISSIQRFLLTSSRMKLSVSVSVIHAFNKWTSRIAHSEKVSHPHGHGFLFAMTRLCSPWLWTLTPESHSPGHVVRILFANGVLCCRYAPESMRQTSIVWFGSVMCAINLTATIMIMIVRAS